MPLRAYSDSGGLGTLSDAGGAGAAGGAGGAACGASEQLAPVVVSAPLEASVLRELSVRLAVLERLVPLVQVLPGRSVG